MALSNNLLSKNTRLVAVSNGAPSVKHRPPDDDFDAVQRIQRALRILNKDPMLRTFKDGKADGQFGEETLAGVIKFQKHAFPNQPSEWDGRVGKKTLAKMDAELPADADDDNGGGGVRPGPGPGPGPGPKPPGPPGPPAPGPGPGPGPSGGLEIINQPAGELVLAHISDSLSKSDATSDMRILNGAKNTRLGRIRVWFAKLGVGAFVLDACEKFATGQFGVGRDAIMRFLIEMIAAGRADRQCLDDITLKAINNFPNVDPTVRMTARATTVNSSLARNELRLAFTTGLAMHAKWAGESAPNAPLRRVPELDATVVNSGGFPKAAKQFEEQMRKNVAAQAKLGKIHFGDLQTVPDGDRKNGVDEKPEENGQATSRLLPSIAPVFPQFNLGLDGNNLAKICIGSFQGVDIVMSGFTADGGTRKFRAKLQYRYIDHFGADDDDVEIDKSAHGSPGQISLWVLQHFAASGHKPFRPHVFIDRTVEGSF